MSNEWLIPQLEKQVAESKVKCAVYIEKARTAKRVRNCATALMCCWLLPVINDGLSHHWLSMASALITGAISVPSVWALGSARMEMIRTLKSFWANQKIGDEQALAALKRYED